MHISSMLLLVVCCLVLLAVTALPTEAQQKDERIKQFEARTFTDAGGKTLTYRLLKPNNYDAKKKYPLVLFLHGAGERGINNTAQMTHGVSMFAFDRMKAKYPCFVLAPQCPGDKRWVEVDWNLDAHVMPVEPSEPMRLTLLLLDAIRQEFNIDKSRLYVTGLSMGGFGAWDIIARRPDLFAAAAPVCGGADEATAPKIKRIAIWAFHGDQDTVVKTIRSQHMIDALRKAGGKPQYTELLNVGHGAWDFAYADSNLYEWMFKQKKR
ncbi:MAG: carboxylesterase family protein [Armatimonadota bacterium]